MVRGSGRPQTVPTAPTAGQRRRDDLSVRLPRSRIAASARKTMRYRDIGLSRPRDVDRDGCIRDRLPETRRIFAAGSVALRILRFSPTDSDPF